MPLANHTVAAHARPSAADQYRRAWTPAEIQANAAAIAFGTGALRQVDIKLTLTQQLRQQRT